MRPVLYTILVVLAAFALAIGCKKNDAPQAPQQCLVTCFKIYPTVKFINFPPWDIDTVIIYSYSGNNNYTNPTSIDSFATYALQSNHYTFNMILKPDYSYRIIIPARNDTFDISNIVIDDRQETMEANRHGCYGLHCGSYPHNATVNGKTATYSTGESSSYIEIMY